MKVGIVGVGYVGAVTGACLAEKGHVVTCFDIDEKRLNGYLRGQFPIEEPGLERRVRKNQKRGTLKFTLDERMVSVDKDIVFLCVGTPPYEDGSANLRFLRRSARMVEKYANSGTVLCEKSTVPVGTAEGMQKLVSLPVAVNPEFLKEGTALRDFDFPDRIVFGTNDKYAAKVIRKLYAPFKAPIYELDLTTAELVKHASNAALALKISFSNVIANLSERAGADGLKVLEMVGLDSRIGPQFLKPGIGYGGSCFPKDVDALIARAKELGVDPGLLQQIPRVNIDARRRFVKKVEKALGGDLEGKILGVLGVAFKPDTDDVREAPQIKIIKSLVERGADVRVYDPLAMQNAIEVLGDKYVGRFEGNAYDAITGSEAMLLLTEWKEFSKLDFKKVKRLMKGKVIADGRNLFIDRADKLKKMGFKYIPVGKQ